jgi:hypothetical protein
MAQTFTNYSPSGAPMETPVPLLNDGGVINFDDFMVLVVQPLIDGVGLAQDTLGLSADTVERVIAVPWNTPNAGEFALTGFGVSVWEDAGVGHRMSAAIDLPHGATLVSVSVYVDPVLHASIAGMTKPAFDIIEFAAATNTGSTIGSGTDPSADATAYSAYHAVVASGLGVAIDRSAKSYFLDFTGESGANSAALLKLYGSVKITYHY